MTATADLPADEKLGPMDDLELTIATWWFTILFMPVGLVLSTMLLARRPTRGVVPFGICLAVHVAALGAAVSHFR